VGIKALNNKISVKLRSIGKNMKNAKMPTSDSYQDYLIEALKDKIHAAAYLTDTSSPDTLGYLRT
jgi:hypothetical protein